MSEAPKVLIVDASKVARLMSKKLVESIAGDAEVTTVGTAEDAIRHLQDGFAGIVITALRLPDDDGINLCQYIRENHPYMPVFVISGDVNQRLEARALTADVTDYFDKSMGQDGLRLFLQGLLQPDDAISGRILYVEDSRVVAHATRKLLAGHELETDHVMTVTDAISKMPDLASAMESYDVVLTDYFLKDNETAQMLLDYVRNELKASKAELPFVVMTGDENSSNQKQILSTGANDLVHKPVDQAVLIKKLKFQIRFSQFHRARNTLPKSA